MPKHVGLSGDGNIVYDVCVCVYLFGLVNEQFNRNPMRVFEKRLLRRIFGPKRDEVTGEWRKLHNEELNDLYSLPNVVHEITSRMRWRYITRMGERKGS